MRKRRARRVFRVLSVLTAVLLLAVIVACGQADDDETAASTGQSSRLGCRIDDHHRRNDCQHKLRTANRHHDYRLDYGTATTAAASPTVSQPKVVESTATEEHPNAIITVEGTPVYGGTLRKGDGVARTIDTYVIEARGTGNTINTSPFRESL